MTAAFPGPVIPEEMLDKSFSEKPKSAAATDSPNFPIIRPRTPVVTLQNGVFCTASPHCGWTELTWCFSVLIATKVELTSPHATKIAIAHVRSFDLGVTPIYAALLCSGEVEEHLPSPGIVTEWRKRREQALPYSCVILTQSGYLLNPTISFWFPSSRSCTLQNT